MATAEEKVATNGEANGHAKTFKYGTRVFKIPHVDMAPELTKEERDNLAKSIQEHGVVQGIVVTEDDTVIAGHNRLFESARLNIPLKDLPIVVRKGSITPEEEEELVVVANFVGRKITAERRAHMAHYLRGKKYSLRRIAALLGCYHTTISEDLEKPDPLAPADAVVEPEPDEVVGQDGKKYRRKKPKKKAAEPAGDEAAAGPAMTAAQKKKFKDAKTVATKLLRVLVKTLDKIGLGEKHAKVLEAILEDVRGA